MAVLVGSEGIEDVRERDRPRLVQPFEISLAPAPAGKGERRGRRALLCHRLDEALREGFAGKPVTERVKVGDEARRRMPHRSLRHALARCGGRERRRGEKEREAGHRPHSHGK